MTSETENSKEAPEAPGGPDVQQEGEYEGDF